MSSMISEHKSHNLGYDIIYHYNHFSVDTTPGNVKFGKVTLMLVVPGVMISDLSSSSDTACARTHAVRWRVRGGRGWRVKWRGTGEDGSDQRR